MILTILSLATSLSTLPNYKAEILARANGGSTYNLPAYAIVNSASPSINDAGEVAFKVISAGVDQSGDRSENSGLWLKTRKDLNGRIVYYSPKEKIVSDPKMLEGGQPLFTQFDEVSSEGLFAFNPDSQNVEHLVEAKNMAAVNYPQAMGDSSYAFRSTDPSSNRSFYEFRKDNLIEVVNEDQGYSYLFGPSVNEASQWVFKARLGEKYNFSEEAADQIVLLNPNFTVLGEKFYSTTVLAKDTDADVLSPYKSFDNSPSISKAGMVVFAATLKNRVRTIVAVKDNVHYVVAREGENDISKIELFSPKINDNGFVVFRAIDSKGLRSIFLANPFSSEPEVKSILTEGDSIMTDQGPAEILHRENFPAFSGHVDINNKNEIVVSLVLAIDNQKWILGTSIYKLHPL